MLDYRHIQSNTTRLVVCLTCSAFSVSRLFVNRLNGNLDTSTYMK